MAGSYVNQECAKIFLELIEESDEQTKELILLQLKLDIESYYNDGMEATLGWEMERHKFINDPVIVVVQECCPACKLKTVHDRIIRFLEDRRSRSCASLFSKWRSHTISYLIQY